MKALVYTEYGWIDRLSVRDVATPSLRGDEVLIRVRYASVNPADMHMLRGEPKMVRWMMGAPRRPKMTVLGADVSGVVEAVGDRVTRFKVGDEVFGDLSGGRRGTFAELAVAKEKEIHPLPEGVGFEGAAAAPLAAITALQALAQVKSADVVLVNGASGGVGSFAVQIAKAIGARVVAVCRSQNVELVRRLGANRVVDRSREDMFSLDERFDWIVDMSARTKFKAYLPLLKKSGKYLAVGGDLKLLLSMMLKAPWRTNVQLLSAKSNPRDLAKLALLLEKKTIVPEVTKTIALEEIPAAIDALDRGEVSGKIVVKI